MTYGWNQQIPEPSYYEPPDDYKPYEKEWPEYERDEDCIVLERHREIEKQQD